MDRRSEDELTKRDEGFLRLVPTRDRRDADALPRRPLPLALPSATDGGAAAVRDVTELERLQDEIRHLRAELLRAREDLKHERARLAYVLSEIAELRKKVPTTQPQAAVPIDP